MAAIAARQQDAFRTLYTRYSDRLFALCLRIVGDRSEAEQILIDVFWEIWNRHERYDPARAAPFTYMALLTRSRCLDHCRRRKADPAAKALGGEQSEIAFEATVATTERPPLNQMLLDERAQSLREALGALDGDERSLIEACFFDGYTHVELADKLKQPLGTVKTRIRRGLARLRLKLCQVYGDVDTGNRGATDGSIAGESQAP